MILIQAIILTLFSMSALASADAFFRQPDSGHSFAEILTIETEEIPYDDTGDLEFAETLLQQSIVATHENATAASGIPLGELVNGFADLLKKVLAPDTPLMKGSVIAEARPAGFESMQLQNSKLSGRAFKKTFKSLLGFKLVEIEYKIIYAYGANANGVGSFIPHILFTPLKVVLDPMWHLQVDSLSLTPRNCGTVEDPIAALEFNVAFKAKGITGTLMATDSYSLNAQTGELSADWRDFQL